MHDVFEFALKGPAHDEQIRDFLTLHFRLPVGRIVSEDDYWGESMTDAPRVGITIEHKNAGLMTNISGVAYDTLDNATLGELTAAASKYFCCEAVVGDFRDERSGEPGAFLSYFPDGTVWESVDSSSGGTSDVNLIQQVR